MRLALDVTGAARFSKDGRYRYWLSRTWGNDHTWPHDLWVMLNPSTASADEDDSTLRLAQKISHAHGCQGGVYVANLFALCSSKPTPLRFDPDPVGPLNDIFLRLCAARAQRIIVAWGAFGALHNRGLLVDRLLRETGKPLFRIGSTLSGQPSHPRSLVYTKGGQSSTPALIPEV